MWAAQLHHPSSTARLYSGLEFNFVARNGQPCVSPAANPVQEDPLRHRCVIDYVAPRVSVDYYSFSAWVTFAAKDLAGENAGYKTYLQRDLNFALSKVRTHRPEIQENNFLIGEYGLSRTRMGETTVANEVNELFAAITASEAKTEEFTPGRVVGIFGMRFSASGNRVVIQQAHQSFVLSQGSGWSETPTQINVLLP